ncbi:IclR family transcriptional regulator domain-containing protein [Streptomyces plumbiresistens]|uniref:IclR-ED domain-containing protein n=1 Tax=Streptomyces plumbiresistens TaxID=511811 RepID=A0ABP7RJJ4_9ACTN
MPFTEGVHDVVGHHVQLGVLDGDEALFLERLTAPGAVINYTRIAGRLPLHASSSGLVLLAHGPAGRALPSQLEELHGPG